MNNTDLPDDDDFEGAEAALPEPQPTPTPGVRMKPRERQEKALDYRIRGLSYREIGAAMDISGKSAFNLVKRAMSRINKEVDERAKEVRELELARLDAMRSALWPRVLKGDTQAIQQALTISVRVGKLTGIESATVVEVKSALETTVNDETFARMKALAFGDANGDE